jgi:hypothetical protein
MDIIKLLESITLALITLLLVFAVIMVIGLFIYLICTGQHYILLGVISFSILFVLFTYIFYKG